MRFLPIRFLKVVLLAALLVMAAGATASAQNFRSWFPDQRIDGYADDAFTPVLIADHNNTVHAFASQWVGDEFEVKGIVYEEWTAERGWSSPNDILLSPYGEAAVSDVFLDDQGTVHLTFWGGEAKDARLYYSHAPLAYVDEAPAWSEPMPIGYGASSPHSGALLGDDHGNLVAIYNGHEFGNGIYAIHSNDRGESWEEPLPIYFTFDTKKVAYSAQLALGDGPYLHAVWNVVSSRGSDLSLHYARYDFDLRQWEEAIQLDEKVDEDGFFGPSYPSIVNNGGSIVVMYNSGNRAVGGHVPAGRPVQTVLISNDEGVTWSDPRVPFPRHVGRSGEHSLTVDSNGIVHAVFMQRIEEIQNNRLVVIDGPWYSWLQGNQWSNPTNMEATVAPHDLRSVISQGNLLLTAWRQDPGVGNDGVWSAYRELDAPSLAVEVFPTPTATPIPTATPEPTPFPTATRFPLGPSGTEAGGPEVTAASGPTDVLVFSMAPVVLMLALLLTYARFGRRN